MKKMLNNGYRWLWIPLLLLATHLEAASTVQFTATSYTVAENAGTTTVTVQRLDDTNTVVGVDYASTNLTVTAGADYTDVTGTLTFAAGETNKSFTVPILNDGLIEGVETFQVILSNPTGGAVLGTRATATVQIKDNDTGIQFEFGAYSVAEDAESVLIGVVRGDDGDFPITVDYSTSDLTARAGLDYTGATNTLTFAPGEKIKLFIIPILKDGLKEPNETFRITLSNPTGGGILGAQKTATVTILDNDPGVQFEFNKYWVQENEGTLTVKVLRGNDMELGPFTVDYATTNASATAGQDYTQTEGTLAFAQGESVKTIAVPILYREQEEPDKQFKLTLSNPSSGVVRGTNVTATITILDMTGMAAHRFDGITVQPDRSIQLTFGGGVSKRFANYFDLYPIEVSTNLLDWEPLVTLVRTKSLTNALTYADPSAAKLDRRFYRTPTNHFIAPLTRPIGPFPAGVISRIVNVPNRRNRYGISTNGSFAVSISYPGVARAGILPASLEDPQLARDPNWPSWYTYGNVGAQFKEREPEFVSHALPDLACAATAAPYPVLIYSPGGWGNRTETAGRGPQLASHGYIVVTGDPADVYASAFPDGRYLYGDGSLGLSESGFADRVNDLHVILDELDRWNREDPVLAGRLQVANVASMGWSWGGGVAADLCRVDARCQAAIILEGYFQGAGKVLATGLSKPCLSIYADPISIPGNEALLFKKTSHDSIWFQIRSTNHDVFGDTYWALGGFDLGTAIAPTIDAYTLWFLNKYLKGIDDPMPALVDYPRVFNLQRK